MLNPVVYFFFCCKGYTELLAQEGAIYPLVGLLKSYANDDSEAVDSLQRELVSTFSAVSSDKKIRKHEHNHKLLGLSNPYKFHLAGVCKRLTR